MAARALACVHRLLIAAKVECAAADLILCCETTSLQVKQRSKLHLVGRVNSLCKHACHSRKRRDAFERATMQLLNSGHGAPSASLYSAVNVKQTHLERTSRNTTASVIKSAKKGGQIARCVTLSGRTTQEMVEISAVALITR